MSRSVSQVYGRALLRAMAPTSSKSPLKELHVSFLSRDEAWTPNEIRKAARGVGMSDNFMFIDDGGKILSCRISCDYGVALLQSLQQSPGEASRTRSPMTQPADASASEIVNDRDMMWESPRHSSQHHNHAQAISSSPPPSVFETPASNYLGTLSDHILSSANRQPYDRDWMNKYGISEAWLLRGPQSKHTLDLLFKHGAIIPGDKLCITYQSPAGPVIKFAEVGKPVSNPLSIEPSCPLLSTCS